MDTDKLQRDLADMRALAEADGEFTQTNVRKVDLSAEDVEAIRIAYLWLARLYKPLREYSDNPEEFGEFGGHQMRRKLPLHRLYAIGERWQARADIGSSRRDLDRALLGSQGSDAVCERATLPRSCHGRRRTAARAATPSGRQTRC